MSLKKGKLQNQFFFHQEGLGSSLNKSLGQQPSKNKIEPLVWLNVSKTFF
jgi:hypothetical protein